jgi:small conductance mechanosensitive channel
MLSILSSNIIFEKLFKLLFFLLLGIVFSAFVNRSISFFFNNLKNQSPLASYKQRLDTLKSLSKSIVSISVFIILFLVITYEFGFNIAPILTGAGILGLAISFGAQTLIKDLIAGFFIILEDQYNVGDEVKIGENEGRVYKITLRTTILEDKEENLTYIPNSEIKKVIVFKKK